MQLSRSGLQRTLTLTQAEAAWSICTFSQLIFREAPTICRSPFQEWGIQPPGHSWTWIHREGLGAQGLGARANKSSCVTLGKSFYYSEPQSPHLGREDNIYLMDCYGD